MVANRKGILVAVSGFSGVGKSELMRRLTAKYGYYALSISATTRLPREKEEDGREYFFKTREEFEQMIKENRFLEYAEYCGNYYGTPKEYVEDQMEQGRDVVLEIDLQGAMQVKKQYPGTLLIFIMPPSVEVLLERLRGRNTEEEEQIHDRLRIAVKESKEAGKYGYIIINDDLEQSVEEIHRLIDSQHDAVDWNREFIAEICEDLETMVASLEEQEKTADEKECGESRVAGNVQAEEGF